MGLKKANKLLCAAYHKAKVENKAKTGVFLEKNLEIKYSFLKKNSNINDLSSKIKHYQKDKADKGAQAFQVNINNIFKAKKRFIRLFPKYVTILK